MHVHRARLDSHLDEEIQTPQRRRRPRRIFQLAQLEIQHVAGVEAFHKRATSSQFEFALVGERLAVRPEIVAQGIEFGEQRDRRRGGRQIGRGRRNVEERQFEGLRRVARDRKILDNGTVACFGQQGRRKVVGQPAQPGGAVGTADQTPCCLHEVDVYADREAQTGGVVRPAFEPPRTPLQQKFRDIGGREIVEHTGGVEVTPVQKDGDVGDDGFPIRVDSGPPTVELVQQHATNLVVGVVVTRSLKAEPHGCDANRWRRQMFTSTDPGSTRCRWPATRSSSCR